MKMEHTLTAPAADRVQAFRCGLGDQVEEGVELVDFAPEEGAALRSGDGAGPPS
jgi:3-methylcrotonyl-CoA carboxylase alpha subunit